MKYKMLSAIRVHAGCVLRITRLNGGVVAYSKTVPEGLYYPSGDGSASDLLAAMGVVAVPVNAFVYWIVDADGIVSAGATLRAGYISLRLDLSDAPDLWDALRLPAGSVSDYVHDFASSALWSGTHCHLGGWYPDENYLLGDLRVIRPLATQFAPDTGNPQTLRVATREEFRLRLRASGYSRPQAGGYTEYHDMMAWYDHATTGVPTRLYPDTAITTAYSASNRLGYEVMSVVPNEAEPTPLSEIYKHWDLDAEALEYTE